MPEPTAWQLEVAEVQDVTPGMRRIQLTSPALTAFEYLPGQDMALRFTLADGRVVRRRYTIRRFDRDRRLLAIDVVLHGGGPGMRWAQGARPGMSIEAIAPRGKITLVEADWHLFAGDATAVPGAFAMMEALPREVTALAFLLVDDPQERQTMATDGADRRLTWRFERSGAGGAELISALAASDIRAGRGHAYLAGEVVLVTRLKTALLSGGWAAEQVSAKAYWNRGRPNADRGEPEQRAS